MFFPLKIYGGNSKDHMLPGFMVNQRLLVDPPYFVLYLKIFSGTPKIFGRMKIFGVQRFMVPVSLNHHKSW